MEYCNVIGCWRLLYEKPHSIRLGHCFIQCDVPKGAVLDILLLRVVKSVSGSLYRNSFFWNFIFAYHPRVEGDCFGSENFEKFWPHMGFSPKLFFQKSSFFSNKSHRWCLVVRLSAERSVWNYIIENCDVMTSDWKKFFGSFHYIDQFPKHIQISADKLQ